MEFYLPKPFRSVFFSFNVSFRHQLGGNFRYLYGFKDINACDLAKLFVGNPVLKPVINYANETFLKGIIRECPYGPGYVRVVNASVNLKTAYNSYSGIQRFPNGDYKTQVRIFNKKDSNALNIALIMENNWRHNAVDGYLTT